MQRSRLRHLLLAGLAILTSLAIVPLAAPAATPRIPIDVMPVKGGKRPARRATLAVRAMLPGNAIDYHGGLVMAAPTINTYAIWYGAWPVAKRAILTDFLSSVGGSPWFAINSGYSDSAGQRPSGKVVLAGQTVDAYSRGKKSLSDASIRTVISDAIAAKRLPADPHGVYFVFVSADVTKRGFGTTMCGSHTYAPIGNVVIKYAFVGEPTGTRLAKCAPQVEASPNGDVGVDAMVNVVAHQLASMVTDPTLNGWYESSGGENADKCSWTFGSMFIARNGSNANVRLGKREYLIQRNWVNRAGASCAMSA